jgi:hypothetical protein
MKKLYLILCLFVAALAASCGPAVHMIKVETLKPAEMPLAYADHTFAIFNAISPNTDSILVNLLAEGAKEALEESSLFEGYDIPVFNLWLPCIDSCSELQDTAYMTSISEQAQAGMLMIIDEASTSLENKIVNGSQFLYVGYKALYRIYDAVMQHYIITERDSIYLKIDGSWQSSALSDSQVQEIWHDVIRRAGGRFMEKTVPQWETTARYYILPSGFYPEEWNTAAYYATRGYWDEAMKIWGKLATSNTGKTAAYAAFNMALGAEMINEYSLALDWLDLADKYAPLTYTTVYRQLIQNRIEEVKKLNNQMNY